MIPVQRGDSRLLVVIAGPTGSGKSTLAQHLAVTEGLAQLSASDLLMQTAGTERPKAERLLSWLDRSTASSRTAVVEADRLADLRVLSACAQVSGGLVVETCGPAALLLDPFNTALLIRLEASVEVRASRLLGHLHGYEISESQARMIVASKDAAMAKAIQAAWGLDLANVTGIRWRFDLVLRCPDDRVCRDPGECREAVRVLARAAVGVHRACMSLGDAGPVVEALCTAIARFSAWVVRVAPALTDPSGPHTPARWRSRLLDEHERQSAALSIGEED